jgi:hypothetical protein
MAVAEEPEKEAIDQIVLTDDHLADLVQDRCDEIAAPQDRFVRRGRPVRLHRSDSVPARRVPGSL